MAYYADIVELQAPPSAVAGAVVSVVAKVKNLYAQAIYIATTGKYDDTVFSLLPAYDAVEAGATYSFSGSFTMPNKNVRVYVWSFFWGVSEWLLDDEAYVDVDLAALVSEFSEFGVAAFSKV